MHGHEPTGWVGWSRRVDLRAGRVTLALSGEIDMASGPSLRSALDSALEGAPAGGLAVDLTGVTFCDSTAVHALVRVLRRARAARRPLVLVMDDACRVRRVLERSGLLSHFDVEDPAAA